MEYACNAVKILQNGEIIRQNIIWCFANMEICIIFASEFRGGKQPMLEAWAKPA